MTKIIAALAFATLVASPALAGTRDTSGFVGLPGIATWHRMKPAMNTWHDDARWPQPPMPTDTYARSQDGSRYQRLDSYDVVMNGQIVGRDPDPNIRFQLLREAGFPQ